MNILVLHGPNLNLLGKREPSIYGVETLDQINRQIEAKAAQLGASVRISQFSCEGDIVDEIQRAAGWASGIIINPAAYTHYSIAIRDALLAVGLPTIEVHLSNVYAREEFRRKSVISDVVVGVVTGLGRFGYICALEYLTNA